jgi:protein-S-isoprenylcysteine O-methyltransferase Ste14
VHALALLRRSGRPDPDRQDVPLFEIERTTRLVTAGAYRYIRHPLYSSLLLLGWGIFFKDPRPLAALLAAAATRFLVATARADERECRRFFGADYEAYMKRTKRFIPFLF